MNYLKKNITNGWKKFIFLIKSKKNQKYIRKSKVLKERMRKMLI